MMFNSCLSVWNDLGPMICCLVIRLSKHRQNPILEKEVFGWSWNEAIKLLRVREVEKVALVT